MLRLVVAAILLTGVQARCASECSGHGCCGKNDICGCYSNWQGADCSQRTCPFGHAWSDTAKGSDMGHNYAECSNRGTCDRKSGLCSCLEGFTGLACGRTACPNDCSGHGTCEHTMELASDTSVAVGGKDFGSYMAWDAGKTRGCKCDAYYTGHDCSKRMCPRGDDPLTTEVDITQTTTTSLQVDEVQNVTVAAVTGLMNGGEVTFTYTDLYNGVWTTRPVTLPLVKTWSNQGGKLEALEFPWVAVGKNVANFNSHQLKVDTTDNSYYYEWEIDSAWAAGVAGNAPRKGDWILISHTAGTSGCTVQVHSTPTATIALKIKGDPIQGPCRLATADATNAAIYHQWTPLATSTTDGDIDGAENTVSSYDSSNGKLRFGPGTATRADPALHNAANNAGKSLTTQIFPGTWLRVSKISEIGAYCDYQVQSSTITCASIADCYVVVDTASPTSTWVDSTNGAGNPTGSSLCGHNFACADCALSVLVDTTHVQRDNTAGHEFPILDGDNAERYALDGAGTLTSTTDGSTALPFHQLTNGGAGSTAYDMLQPGVEFHLFDDASGAGTGNLQWVCVGLVGGTHLHKDTGDAVGNTLTVVSTGTIAGATPTQCATLTKASFQGAILIRGANSLVFDADSDDTNQNPFYFNGLQRGDRVNGFGIGEGTDTEKQEGSVLYTVEHVVSSYTDARALKLKTGSMPNGGGMYPVLPVASDFSGGAGTGMKGSGFATTGVYLQTAPKALFAGAIAQAFSTAQAGSYWAGSTALVSGAAVADTQYSDSAADVKRALEELPNHVIDTVDVTMTSAALGLYAYSVTFSGARNAGDQHNVVMNSKGCNADGCQPRYTGVRTQKSRADADVVTTTASFSGSGTTDNYATSAGGDEIVVYRDITPTAVTDTAPPARHLTQSAAATSISLLYPHLAAATSHAATLLVLKALGDHDDKPYDFWTSDLDMSEDHKVLFASATYEITRGTKEGTECSGRGNCDYDTGLCECTEGYTGEACATQTCLL